MALSASASSAGVPRSSTAGRAVRTASPPPQPHTTVLRSSVAGRRGATSRAAASAQAGPRSSATPAVEHLDEHAPAPAASAARPASSAAPPMPAHRRPRRRRRSCPCAARAGAPVPRPSPRRRAAWRVARAACRCRDRRTTPCRRGVAPGCGEQPGLSVSRLSVRRTHRLPGPRGWPVSAARPEGRSMASTGRAGHSARRWPSRRLPRPAARAYAQQRVDGEILRSSADVAAA